MLEHNCFIFTHLKEKTMKTLKKIDLKSAFRFIGYSVVVFFFGGNVCLTHLLQEEYKILEKK